MITEKHKVQFAKKQQIIQSKMYQQEMCEAQAVDECALTNILADNRSAHIEAGLDDKTFDAILAELLTVVNDDLSTMGNHASNTPIILVDSQDYCRPEVLRSA